MKNNDPPYVEVTKVRSDHRMMEEINGNHLVRNGAFVIQHLPTSLFLSICGIPMFSPVDLEGEAPQLVIISLY